MKESISIERGFEDRDLHHTRGGENMYAKMVAPGVAGGSILIGACTWGTYPDIGADCIRGYFPHCPGVCNAGKVPVCGG